MDELAVDKFKKDIRFRKKIVHVETIPSKEAIYDNIEGLEDNIQKYLDKNNIKLYKHQVTAYNKIKDNKNIIITTPTASGKTLAFNLPIAETLTKDKNATAMYIYPAKALTQDQLKVLKDLEEELNIDINPERYDGDTPKSSRYAIRQKSRVILTNPYQIHHILSWHHQWKRFYSNLKYIIIDEAHYYKGIFGTNVAYLIRRLKRIAKFYGGNPQFILSSATLANPLELAERLTGEKFHLIDEDSSPSGEKDFVLYNPFIQNKTINEIECDENEENDTIDILNDTEVIEDVNNGENNNKNNKIKPIITRNENTKNNKSIHQETELIFIYLILKNVQTLCFTISRKMAELIAMWAKQDMANYRRRLVNHITAYRAGYLPEERRDIEEGLKSRHYIGVTCTNALELGINIGSLDAVIISGYPGTMISVWQQAGRAGRENQKSLVVFLAFENQLDQYFMNNPDFFFDKAHENAIIDLSNEIINKAHLLCASYELSLKEEEIKDFNLNYDQINQLIREGKLIKHQNNSLTYGQNNDPSFEHSLNQLSSEVFTVINNDNGQVIETLEKSQMYREAHEGAVLINKGESYIVSNVDLKKRIVKVSKQNVEYHTSVFKNVTTNIIKKIKKVKIGNFTLNFGELEVEEDFYKYKKIHFSKTLGTFYLDLPPLKFKTKGLWFTIDENQKDIIEKEIDEKDAFPGGLHGLEHALISLYPLHVMCDRFDIGGLSTNYHQDTQEPTIFIYDAYEGGIGINEKAVEVFKELSQETKNLIKNCQCIDGCPSCIYSPKCGNDNQTLNKKATEI
ncbi:MAG: DEAD/DEAH box helicase, partial [Methanobrevibacter sp.]|nr:DEAD/DEAH box helicase [Methanobrevibacter sp.]